MIRHLGHTTLLVSFMAIEELYFSFDEDRQEGRSSHLL